MSLIRANALHLPLADGVANCCVTSPPYWGLRDYGVAPTVWGGEPSCSHVWGDTLRAPWANSVSGPNGTQKNTAKNWTKESGAFCASCGAWLGALGLEPTPELFVSHLVLVFAEVRRVLKPDGVLWMNLGDSYATVAGGVGECPGGGKQGENWKLRGKMTPPNRMKIPGFKSKDLIGVPWMAAFALRAAGWYLRSDVIWSKPNPMPESIRDRPTKAHEYLFLLSKSERYFYDADAIKEPYAEITLRDREHDGGLYSGTATKDYKSAGAQNPSDVKRRIAAGIAKKNEQSGDRRKVGFNDRWDARTNLHANGKADAEVHGRDGLQQRTGIGRNKRSVWTIPTMPYHGAHFATMPEALVEPCILAGCPLGGLVLDPFIGSGTVGAVAERLGRRWIGVDLKYQQLSKKRTAQRGLMFTEASA